METKLENDKRISKTKKSRGNSQTKQNNKEKNIVCYPVFERVLIFVFVVVVVRAFLVVELGKVRLLGGKGRTGAGHARGSGGRALLRDLLGHNGAGEVAVCGLALLVLGATSHQRPLQVVHAVIKRVDAVQRRLGQRKVQEVEGPDLVAVRDVQTGYLGADRQVRDGRVALQGDLRAKGIKKKIRNRFWGATNINSQTKEIVKKKNVHVNIVQNSRW